MSPVTMPKDLNWETAKKMAAENPKEWPQIYEITERADTTRTIIASLILSLLLAITVIALYFCIHTPETGSMAILGKVVSVLFPAAALSYMIHHVLQRYLARVEIAEDGKTNELLAKLYNLDRKRAYAYNPKMAMHR